MIWIDALRFSFVRSSMRILDQKQKHTNSIIRGERFPFRLKSVVGMKSIELSNNNVLIGLYG